nr:class I SAM-dependent methyltransferase [Desulfobulbaceae bacterium]
MISKEQTLSHLRKGLAQLDIELPSPAICEQLYQYFAELLKWSPKVNLVAKGPELELLETHFIDSLTLVPILKKYLHDDNSHNLLDIGSGAGFPGLVLKITFPDLPVTLVEPRQKRTVFL